MGARKCLRTTPSLFAALEIPALPRLWSAATALHREGADPHGWIERMEKANPETPTLCSRPGLARERICRGG
ncbi:hypothetical protein BDW72DRAFT_177602 [Aspergillus terricola var. indicus]